MRARDVPADSASPRGSVDSPERREEPDADSRGAVPEYTEDYFSNRRLENFKSRFQRYRASKVLSLHELRPRDRVLDMGCGWGTISFAAGERASSVVGVDFSREAVARCRDRRARRPGARNVRFLQADARGTGLESGTFDVVYAADLLEHLEAADSLAVVREAFRCLREGGAFVVWMPCPNHFIQILKARGILLQEDQTHVGYKSMDETLELLRAADFEVTAAKFVESHWPGLNLLERIGQRWIPLLRRRIAVVGRRPK